MYDGRYAPWEHYPKTLRQSEIQNPLTVVKDFFSAGDVEDHNSDLKEWRDCVINDRYYNDKRHGPGNLLFTYDLTLKILEAAYLLLLVYRDNFWKREKLKEEQLAEEKDRWAYFLSNLSLEELLNPYLVIKRIFKKIKPQKYRDYLKDWLHAALYKGPIDETVLPGEIITVYENLLQLYSAVWLIHQREIKNEEVPEKLETVIAGEGIKKTVGVNGITPNPTAAEKSGLNQIQQFISKRFTSVQMIVHLGTHHHPFTFFLLILIADNERISEGELSNKIEDHCRHLAKVHVLVHKSSSARSGIEAGNRFWTNAVARGYIIYQSPALELPAPKNLSDDYLIERASFHWDRWGKQAKEFLDGAEFYRSRQNYRLTAFLLHQVVESTLKAVIQAVLGYRVQMHNLSRLLRLSLLITDELKNVFRLDSKEGVQEFTLLQNAYSQSRYNNSFEPDETSINALTDTITAFYHSAETIYSSYVEKLK
ncbi:HEPN domain-containing protein [Mucilaginibacter sp.]|uniref:HEPN domain-containing protein n=1 Tax=Mucilaginibacter sp. TaxID=1882438 RepID=UPI00262CF7CB|nr:HEPN domain-containing protein [Mucilaginibacter sp.]